MGIVIRQSLKSTAATLVGALLGAASIIIGSRLVNKQELGFTRIFAIYGSVAGILLTAGFHGVMSIFLFRYPDSPQKRASLTGISLAVPMLLSLLCFVFYFLFRDHLLAMYLESDKPLFDRFFLWFPVLSLLVTIQSVMEAFLMTEMKITVFTTVREVGLKGGNLLLILLYGWSYISFAQWIYSIVGLYVVANALLLFVARHTGNFRLSFDWRVFSRRELYEIFHFAGYHALLGVTVYVVVYLDSLMLPALDKSGLNASAVYTNALFIISILQIPYRTMTVSVTPNLTEAYSQGDHPKVQDLFLRSSTNIFLASLGMAILIVANLRRGVELLGPGYEAVVPLVVVLMIGRLLDAATGINEQLLSISRHYRYSFVLSLLLGGILLGLGWILIPLYGVWGAAWASTLALGLYNLGKWMVVWRKTGLQPFTPATLRLLLAATGALLPALLIPEIPVWIVDVAVRTVVTAGLYLALLLWLRPSADFEAFAGKILRRKAQH